MDIDNVDLEYILGDQVHDMQLEAERYFENECRTEASAAQTEDEQKKLYDLSNQSRVDVKVSGNGVSVRLYFLSVADELSDYAELIRSNVYSIINARLQDMVSDRLASHDVQVRLVEFLGGFIAEEIQNKLGGGTK